METVAIISLLLNLAAVIGVILLHIRQVQFERRVSSYLQEGVAHFTNRINEAKATLLKVAGGIAIVAVLKEMLKKEDGPHV